MSTDNAMQAAVEHARSDLADRLGVEPADIEVIEAKQVTWRDGSLGCPEPGHMYTQALVEGTLIRLRADGQVHEYHGGSGRTPFLCPPDRAQAPLKAHNESAR